MDSELLAALKEEGVKENVIDILEEEELDSVEILNTSAVTDELLQQYKIKGGQIVRLRKALEKIQRSTSSRQMPQDSVSINNPPSHSEDESLSPLPLTPGSSGKPSGSCTPCSSTSSMPRSKTLPPQQRTPSSGSSNSASPSASMIVPPPSTKSPVSFAIKEKLTPQSNWIQGFKLPAVFPDCVFAELKEGYLSGNGRDRFTKAVCHAVLVHTMRPSPKERDRIVHMIIEQYPFLEDSLGAGFESWQKALNTWFKNVRRKSKDASAKKQAPKTKKTAAEAPAFKKRRVNLSDLPDLPEGETEETCLEHIKALQKEMDKVTNKNQALIRELMDTTFSFRREKMFEESERIEEVLHKYPALQLVSELKAETGRVFQSKSSIKNAIQAYKDLQPKIINFVSSSNNGKLAMLLKSMKEDIAENPGYKEEIESTVTAVALQVHLKEKQAQDDFFLKICSEDDDIDEVVAATQYPRIIGSGSLKLDPLMIVGEGKIIAKLKSGGMSEAVALLLGVYYIFNMEYPPTARSVFAFLECILLDHPELAKKRVLVQKFIKDLHVVL